MKHRLPPLPLLLLFYTPGALAEEPTPGDEPVFPQRLSARDLLYACNASALTGVGRERRRYCAGFISGVEEAARLLRAGSGQGAYQRSCMPADVSSRRLADILYPLHRPEPVAAGRVRCTTGAPGTQQRVSLPGRGSSLMAQGVRAGIARAALWMSGFKQVLYPEGHMSGWQKAGFPQHRVTDGH